MLGCLARGGGDDGGFDRGVLGGPLGDFARASSGLAGAAGGFDRITGPLAGARTALAGAAAGPLAAGGFDRGTGPLAAGGFDRGTGPLAGARTALAGAALGPLALGDGARVVAFGPLAWAGGVRGVGPLALDGLTRSASVGFVSTGPLAGGFARAGAGLALGGAVVAPLGGAAGLLAAGLGRVGPIVPGPPGFGLVGPIAFGPLAPAFGLVGPIAFGPLRCAGVPRGLASSAGLGATTIGPLSSIGRFCHGTAPAGIAIGPLSSSGRFEYGLALGAGSPALPPSASGLPRGNASSGPAVSRSSSGPNRSSSPVNAGMTCLLTTGRGVSTASRIASSSVRRACDPGGGGGWVLLRVRGAGLGSGVRSTGSGSSGASGSSGRSSPTSQPDARSAIRLRVASPRRRRVRSSSGTPAP